MVDTPPEIALPEELPVLPLREFVVFPYMTLPLLVTRGPSVAAVEDALAGNGIILLVAQRDPENTEPDSDDLHSVGTAALILRSVRTLEIVTSTGQFEEASGMLVGMTGSIDLCLGLASWQMRGAICVE